MVLATLRKGMHDQDRVVQALKVRMGEGRRERGGIGNGGIGMK